MGYEMVSKSKSQFFLTLSGTHMNIFSIIKAKSHAHCIDVHVPTSQKTLTIEHRNVVIIFRAHHLTHSLANTCLFGNVSLGPRPTTSDHIPLNIYLGVRWRWVTKFGMSTFKVYSLFTSLGFTRTTPTPVRPVKNNIEENYSSYHSDQWTGRSGHYRNHRWTGSVREITSYSEGSMKYYLR